MSVINSITIRLDADPTGLREGLERGKQLIQQFARDPRLVAIPEGATISAGERAAANLIAGLKNKLGQAQTTLIRDLVNGDITLAAYEKLGLEARLRFNQALSKGAEDLRAQNLLGKNTAAVVAREMDVNAEIISRKQAALAADLAKKQAAAATAAAQKARAANVFDPRLGLATTTAGRGTDQLLKQATAQFNTTQNALKTQLAAGLIDKRQFTAQGQAASAAFNAALVAGLNRLEGIKGFSDNMRTVIVDNFKLTGRQAANALGGAIRDTSKTAAQEAAAPFIANATMANRIAGVGRTMSLAITAPIVAAGVKTLGVAKEFEDAMINLRVRTGATATELDKLATESRRIAKTSQFGAPDIAQAQGTLATRGGLGLQDVLRATQPVVNLATAQNVDLARSTEIVTGAMRQFNLAGVEAPHVVDLLAKAAKLGGVNVDDLGTALNFVGPAAHNSGLSLQQTLGTLAALIPAVGGATRAGTTFNGMLKALQDPTKQQAAALRRMGVDVLDTQGQIRPLSVIVGELETKLKGAGASYAQFGQRAGVGAAALLALGAEKLQKFNNELDHSGGTAAKDAADRMSGLSGILKQLAASAQEVAIAFAQSGLLGAVKTAAEVFVSFLHSLSNVPAPVLATIVVLASLAATLGPMIYTIAKVAAGINVMRATMALAAGAQGAGALATSFISLGSILAVGSIVLVGIAALIGLIYASGAAARAAQKDFEAYQQRLTSIASASGAQTEIIGLNTQLTQALRDQEAAQKAIDRRTANEPVIIREGQDLPKLNPARDLDQKNLDQATQRVALITSRLTEANKVWQRFADSETASAKAAADLKRQLGDIAFGDHFPVDDAPGRQKDVRSPTDLLIDRLNEAIELNQALREAGIRAVNPYFDLSRALSDVNQALVLIPDRFGAGAQNATKLLRAAERVRAEMRAVNVAGDQLDLTESVNRKVPNVPQSAAIAGPVFASLTQNVSGFRLTMAKVSGITNTLGEGFSSLAKTVNSTIPALSRFLDGAARIADGVQAISSAAAAPRNLVARNDNGSVDAFGTVGNVLSLVGTVGAAVGAVTSVVSFLTASSKQARETQQHNTEALDKLREQIQQQQRGAGLNVDARNALNAIQQQRGFDFPTGLSAINSRQATQIINSITQPFGITLDQLNTIAQSFGITLLDNGHLVGGALQALLTALNISSAAIGQFSQTLDDQRTAMDLLQNVTDVKQTPQQTIKNQIALLTQFSKPLGAAFAGLSADTVEGRKAIKAALTSLIQTLVSTGITAEQLGNFQSLSELLSVLTSMEGAFDDLATTANTVSEALSNIPSGFRVALRTFEATTPVPPPLLVPQAPTPPHTPIPTTGGIPEGTFVTDNSVTFTGDITITPGEGETAEQAFTRIVRSARTRARGRGAPSDSWPTEVG